MAAPGLSVSPKHFYLYVADNGTQYKILLSDYIATQNDTAGASIIGAALATTPGLGRFPGKGYKPRRAVLRDLVHNKDREVIVCTRTAPLITVPTPAGANTLALNSGVNNTEAYTYEGRYKTEVLPGERL